MWIHFDDIPIGTEFDGFFGTPTYRKTANNGARNLHTDRVELRTMLLQGFTMGYFFFKI